MKKYTPVIDGTITVAFEEIDSDIEITFSTTKDKRSEIEAEVRYFVDRTYPEWQFVNYAFGTCTGTIFK